jgi:hypothetical protein
MGRHRLDYHWLWNSGCEVKSANYQEIDTLRRWELFYGTPYSKMVGARIRRARTARELTQRRLLDKVERPRGGTYSTPVPEEGRDPTRRGDLAPRWTLTGPCPPCVTCAADAGRAGG